MNISLYEQFKDFLFGYNRKQLLKLIKDKNTCLSQQEQVIKELLKQNKNLSFKIEEVKKLLRQYTETMNHHGSLKK